jgi:hypothetical protein
MTVSAAGADDDEDDDEDAYHRSSDDDNACTTHRGSEGGSAKVFTISSAQIFTFGRPPFLLPVTSTHQHGGLPLLL